MNQLKLSGIMLGIGIGQNSGIGTSLLNSWSNLHFQHYGLLLHRTVLQTDRYNLHFKVL